MPAPSDGRAFTSYLSSGQREEALRRQAGATTETEYRQYLQRNAAKVAAQQQAVAITAIRRG